MPDGGVLTLCAGAAQDGTSCDLTVADTGTGIAAEHLDKLFTPFFTTRESVTGLGLLVSYRIVKDHKGTIRPESTREGALITVSLPLQQNTTT